MAREKASAAAPVLQAAVAAPDPALRVHHASALEPLMREWKTRDRVPPVLLLTGKAGIGKRTLTHWLATWMQCHRNGWKPAAPAKEETGGLFGDAPSAPTAAQTASPAARAESLAPCGECPSCLKAAHGTQVDQIEILPEAGGSDALKIDQFRDLKSRLGFSAHESAFRVVMIPRAHAMTAQAANSLLKLLEEPPPGWVFLLTAHDATLLLPTLVSRCQVVRLRPLGSALLEKLLLERGVASERARLLAHISEGSLGRALAALADGALEKRGQVFEFLSAPAPLLTPIVDWAAADGLEPLLDQLESITHDLIRASVAHAPALGMPTGDATPTPTFSNSDGQLALTRHYERLARSRGLPKARAFWVERSQELARARGVAHTPVNRKILVQDLLLGWME